MSYRRALLLRWSRRDRLAVLIVAVTVAFLVGTAVLVVAAGDQVAAIASEYGARATVERYDSVTAATAAAPSGAAVLPVAAARDDAGHRVTVVARTASAQGVENTSGIDLFASAGGVSRGTLDAPREVRFDGNAGRVRTSARPRDPTVLSPAWYVASPGVVERLGTTGALVVTPTDDPVPTQGTPLLSALAFFLAGTRETLRTLTVAAVGAGLLVGVTVYSVTDMTIRDRRDAIRVARATGARPGRLLAVFGLRGTLLTGVGTGVGYAAGVILPSAIINVAVFAGLPTSLRVSVTAGVARLLGAVLVAVVVVGAAAATLAAWSTLRRPPAASHGGRAASRSGRRLLAPRLLARSTLVPTAATLTAFVVFAVIAAGLAGAVAPLAAPGGATITEPGAVHPIASDVPQAYAAGLRARGIDASPEILAFATSEGRPFLVRGVNATAFTSVSDARVTAGRYPRNRTEALVGADLSRTLGVERGDRLLLGGSTTPAVTEVRIVGVVTAPGAVDDQLLVSLPTARHLSGQAPGRVQFVRTAGNPRDALGPGNDGTTGNATVGVVGVSVPDRVPANATLRVRIRVRNDALATRTSSVTAAFDGRERTRRLTLAPGEARAVSVSFPTRAPGTYTLRVDGQTRNVAIVSENAIELVGVPARAPPNSTPRVRVRTITGEPVANATVSVRNATTPIANRTVRTGPDGIAAVPLGGAGRRTITARSGTETDTAVVPVVEGTPRLLGTTIGITPAQPSVLTRPRVRLALANPWNRTLSRTISIDAPGGVRTRVVTLGPGGETTIAVDLPRRPPGTYTVRARIDGVTVADRRYEVTGDDRIAAAALERAGAGGSSIGRAVDVAFGNLELVIGILVALAGLMTVGGTTAAFARAVHGRRRTIGIYRSTGATPRRVLALVLGDAARIGLAATALAIVAGLCVLAGFAAAGLLVPFGVRLAALPPPGVLLGIAAAALGVALTGATLATLGFLREAPAHLLADDRVRRVPGEADD